MSIQLDISDVIAEVGVGFTITRQGIELDGVEYFTYTPNSQVTKPFVREHFLEVAFKSDTAVKTGDTITVGVSNDTYLVMNNTPDFFENEIIRHLAVLYKINAVADILRPQHTRIGYDTSFDFVVQYPSVPILIYAPLFGNVLGVNADVGTYSSSAFDLYISADYAIEVGDRMQITNVEYYAVDVVIPRRFPNILVCGLSEDTRE